MTSYLFIWRALFGAADGFKIDMHLREWLNCIRLNNGTQPSCDIDQSFQEAITAHMGTISYHEGRRTYWDEVNEEIT